MGEGAAKNPQRDPTTETLVDFLGAPDVSLDPTPEPEQIFGRYNVLGLLGAGGMGRVYRVWDRALEDVVALKLLLPGRLSAPEAVLRFRQEVKLARRISHPNVVRTFDLGEQDGSVWLTMEYVHGRSLRRALAEDGPMPAEAVLALARSLSRGLSAAHQAGVLHCDLKPDNILLGEDGRVAITDFGIARAIVGQSGGVLGTPAYMAPEQVEGGQLSAASDLFALGAALFEALTGRRAFPGDLTEALHSRGSAPPDPRAVAAVPDALAQIILRLLSPRPIHRPQSAEELLTSLDRINLGAPAPTARDRGREMTPSTAAVALAVRPMLNQGPPEDAHLALGLTEELIDALAATRGLRVRPLHAVVDLDPSLDAQAVGERLGVAVVVEGSVRRQGAQVQTRVRAYGVADGFQIWAQRFSGPVSEILDVSDTIANAVAGAVAVELPVPARRPTTNRAVVELYLRARHELRANWVEGAARASALLSEALQLDPDDPAALATYALVTARRLFYEESDANQRVRELGTARAAADRAVAMAPELGEGWLAVATVALYSGDTPSAAAALQATVLRSPGLARAQQMLGNLALEVGLDAMAGRHLQAALAIDPDLFLARLDVGRLHALRAEWEALDPLLEAPVNDGPERPYLQALLEQRARLWGWPGRARIALPLPRRAAHEQMLSTVIQGYQIATDERRVTPEIREMARGLESVLPLMRAVRCQWVAEICCGAGEAEEALHALRLGVASGILDDAWMSRCPALGPLRAHREWRGLAAVVAERAARVRAALDGPTPPR